MPAVMRPINGVTARGRVAEAGALTQSGITERDFQRHCRLVGRVGNSGDTNRILRIMMTPLAALFAVAMCLGLLPAPAQAQQPYAGFEGRPIKALSDRDIADLRAGRGMGMALAAELNGYPGPMHVLELADSLGLSGEQRDRMQNLFAAMKSEAIPLGEKLIVQEAELDRQFAAKTVTPDSLRAAMASIGSTQAALREAHLKYHLSTLDVLAPGQVERYRVLRGYGGHRMHIPGRH
jgi:Spy/CpxP family protein refolding chaperone